MLQGSVRGFLVEVSRLMQHPKRIERGQSGVPAKDFLQPRRACGVFPFPQQSDRGVPMPLVRVSQQGDEFSGRFDFQVDIRFQWPAFAAKPVNAARRAVNLVLVMLAVGDVVFVEVGHVQRAVRRVGDINRPESGVAAGEHGAELGGFEGGTQHAAFAGDDDIVKRVEENIPVPPRNAVPSATAAKWENRRTVVSDFIIASWPNVYGFRGGPNFPGSTPCLR